MTTPHTPPAALPDVAAIEAPDARDNLRRVRAMHNAAPPEGCDDGDRSPALERVVALLAHGHSMHYLDPRDVRCLAVAFDDAEQIIDALQGQTALLRSEVNELRAKVAAQPILAPDVAAIEARTAAYESAARAYATADHGAAGRAACEAMHDTAHESAADIPALLAALRTPAAQSEEIAAALRAAYEAGDALTAALDALDAAREGR